MPGQKLGLDVSFDVKSDGMDPPAFLSAEAAGRSLPPRISLEEEER